MSQPLLFLVCRSAVFLGFVRSLVERILVSLSDIARALFAVFNALLGIPVKVNIVSGGKPNGIPERR